MRLSLFAWRRAAVVVMAGVLCGAAAAADGPLSLRLVREGLQVQDDQGRVLQQVPLRGKQLQTRRLGQGADAETLAVLLDADNGQPRVYGLPAGSRSLRAWATPPQATLAVEAQCLHVDAQGLPQLFLLAEDGRAEQWLLRQQGAMKLRSLALPPQAAACTVDDESGWLLVAEPALGVWAYDIALESAGGRQPLALRAPWGPLAFEPHRLALQGGRLQVRAEEGEPGEADVALPARAAPAPLPVVLPRVQTEPVARLGDAADDPAIWVHPTRPARSRVLATNKKQGLLVYDLAGRQRQLLESGRLNNVDVRQRIRAGTGWRDLAVATQRDEAAVVLFDIGHDGRVSELARLPTGLDDVYGICAARSREAALEVFANDKDGRFVHLRVLAEAGAGGRLAWRAETLRQFRLASQPEGCVVDEAHERLFVGEEDRGIWALSSRGDAPAVPELVLSVGALLQADVEGLALYHGVHRSWLVASSQGNDSYVVLDAQPPYTPRGAFRIGLSPQAAIDAASETDGLDVTSAALGPAFPHGLLVVQDGHKRLPEGPQNFKYASWSDVVRALQLEDVPAR
ncbi:MAG: phytase [Pseudomonadota bacterium]